MGMKISADSYFALGIINVHADVFKSAPEHEIWWVTGNLISTLRGWALGSRLIPEICGSSLSFLDDESCFIDSSDYS